MRAIKEREKKARDKKRRLKNFIKGKMQEPKPLVPITQPYKLKQAIDQASIRRLEILDNR